MPIKLPKLPEINTLPEDIKLRPREQLLGPDRPE
jgi:hypothetical protein